MAINVKYLMTIGLEPYDLMTMELISQNASEDMVESMVMYLDEEHLKRLMALDLLEYVKSKKKSDHDFKRLRLNKRGREILRDARKADYTKEDGELFEYLSKIYGSMEKPLGNSEKVKELLAWFRVETGYSRRQIYKAIKLYVSIKQDTNDVKYISSLENLLWKPRSVFSTKWALADSKLYQFINENKALLNADTASKKPSK